MSNAKVHCHLHKCLSIDQAESHGTNPHFENYGLHIYVQWSVHRIIYGHNYPTRWNSIQFIYICQRSTCFGWYFHPSPEAHNTASTVSGINETVTATCRDWMGDVHHR